MAESFGADAEGYDRNRPGCRVLGVEPDARMAGLARESGVEAFGAVYHRVLPDMPAMFSRGTSVLEGYSAMFTRAADGIRAADAFVDPEQRRFDWEGRYTRDEWLARCLPSEGTAGCRRPPAMSSGPASGPRSTRSAAVRDRYATVAVTATR